MNGLMEPHIFSRFEKISLELRFDFIVARNKDPIVWEMSMGIDSEFNILREDCIRFSNFLKRTKIIRDFTKVISNSLKIAELWITILILAQPAPNDDIPDYDSLDDVYFIAVDRKAVELFVRCGILNPLRKLLNVSTALTQVLGWDGEPQELHPKYKDMLEELEGSIESKSISKSSSRTARENDDENTDTAESETESDYEDESQEDDYDQGERDDYSDDA